MTIEREQKHTNRTRWAQHCSGHQAATDNGRPGYSDAAIFPAHERPDGAVDAIEDMRSALTPVAPDGPDRDACKVVTTATLFAELVSTYLAPRQPGHPVECRPFFGNPLSPMIQAAIARYG